MSQAVRTFLHDSASLFSVPRLRLRPPELPRALAFAIAPIGVLISIALERPLMDISVMSRFLFFFPAVALTSWLAGLGPGLVAVGLSALAGNFLFLEPHGTWSIDPHSLGTTSLFALASAVVAALCASFRSAFVQVERLGRAQAEAQEALRRREATLLQAGKMAHFGAWDIDLSGDTELDENPLVWSDEVYRIFGYEPGAVVPSNALFFEHVHPDDRIHVREAISRSIAARSPYAAEHRVVRPDGTERCVQEYADLVFDEQGQLAHIIGAVQDITERKRVEEALRQNEQRLREAEEVVRLAAELADFVTFDYRPQSGQLTWSEQARHQLGLPPDAEVSYDSFLSSVHPDDRQRVDQAVQTALRPEGGGHYFAEYRTISKQDGSEHWRQARARVFFDDQGRAIRLVGGGIDVTERRRFDELRERLFGIVGHDLRAPLGSIKMAADLLAETLPPEHARMIGIIARSADRMSRMITQLLDFTRVRFAAGVELEKQRFSLATQVREVLMEVEVSHPKRTLLTRMTGNCVGDWDRDRMSQVISNLLGNAIDHGSIDRPIEVRVRDEGPEVVLEVHNWGTPIAPDVLPIIFDPFRRAARQGRGGLGLGLYISREIVAAHGGHIDVVSNAEDGTTFTARLPR